MRRSGGSLAAIVSLFLVAACGAETGDDSGVAAGAQAGSRSGEASSQAIRACALLDLAEASAILGPGTEHPGDTEELTCMYSNPGKSMLTVQLGGAELYDQITIMPPHTATQIGSRGRYSVQQTGAVAVQFVKGTYSVTMSVQPFSAPGTAFLDPLLSAARQVANRLP